MLPELLPIQTTALADEAVPTVNARDLHAFLGVGKDFSTWIKDRLAKIGFVEGQDYVCTQGLSVPSGNSKARIQRTIEYQLTINSAIQIAAAQKSARPLIVQKFIESIQDVSALWNAIRNIELPDDLPEPMYVYAIKNPDTGNIKIGVSKDPDARLRQLLVGNDADLRLVLVEQVDAPNRFRDERLFHKENGALRIRGEWFHPGAQLN